MSTWLQLLLFHFLFFFSLVHASSLSDWVATKGKTAALTDCANKLKVLTKDASTSSDTLSNCEEICKQVALHYLGVGYVNAVISKRSQMMKNCAIIFFNNDITNSYIAFSGTSTQKQLDKNTKAKVALVPYVPDSSFVTSLSTTYKEAITTAYKANHGNKEPSDSFWLKAYKCSEDKSLAYVTTLASIKAIAKWNEKTISLYSGWKPCEITEQVFTLLKTKSTLTEFRCGYTYATHEAWSTAVKPVPKDMITIVPQDKSLDKFLGIVCPKTKPGSYKSAFKDDVEFFSNYADDTGVTPPYCSKGSLTSLYIVGDTELIPNFPKEDGNPVIKTDDKGCVYFVALSNLDKVKEFTTGVIKAEKFLPKRDEDFVLQPAKITPYLVLKNIDDNIYDISWKNNEDLAEEIKELIIGHDSSGENLYFDATSDKYDAIIANSDLSADQKEQFQDYLKLFPAISDQAKTDFTGLLREVELQIPVKTKGEVITWLETYYSEQATLDAAKKMKKQTWD